MKNGFLHITKKNSSFPSASSEIVFIYFRIYKNKKTSQHARTRKLSSSSSSSEICRRCLPLLPESCSSGEAMNLALHVYLMASDIRMHACSSAVAAAVDCSAIAWCHSAGQVLISFGKWFFFFSPPHPP